MGTPIEFRVTGVCAGDSTCTISFPITLPSTNYTVNVDTSWDAGTITVDTQTTSGCVIHFSNNSPSSALSVQVYCDEVI